MSSLYLSQMRQNPQYQNIPVDQLARMVYDQDAELQQISFEQFMPIFNDTGEVSQAAPAAQQMNPAPAEEMGYGQIGLDSIDAAQSGFLNASAGLAEGVGGIYKWATGEESETAGDIAGYLRDAGDDQIQQMSESGRNQMQNFGVEYSSEDGPSMREGSTLVGGLLNIASGVGSSIPYLVPGGLGAKVLSQSGRAVGGTIIPSLARKQAMNLPAGRIPQSLSMAAVGGTGLGGETKNQAYQKAYNSPAEELNKTPAYQAAYWEIADTYKAQGTKVSHAQIEEMARTAVAEAAGDDAFKDGFQLGAVSMGALGPMFLNNVLGRVKGNFIKRAASGASIEGTQELVESGGQAYLSNLAVNENANSSIQPMDNVVSESLTGALIGAGTGGSMSLAGGFGSKAVGITKAKDMPGYFREQERLRKEGIVAEKEQAAMDAESVEPAVEEGVELVEDTETPTDAAETPTDAAETPTETLGEALADAEEQAALPAEESADSPDRPESSEVDPVEETTVEESPEKANYRADLQIALDIALAQSKNRKLTPEARQAASDRIAGIQDEINKLDETLASTELDLEIETPTPVTPASNPALTKRILEWSKVQPDKASDRYDEQRVYKDAIIRELKSLMKMEVGSDQAFRKEESIRMMEEKFDALAPTPLNEVPRLQQALEEEDAATVDSTTEVQDDVTGDNLYDVFANQETNPFASTDLFGRLQPIEEDGIAVDLQGVVRDNMNSLRANGTPDDKKLNRKAVNKILTKDTEYIETLTKTSAINNTVRRQYRKINAELGKASSDYYIQSLGRAMGLFSSPTPTKLAMYDEYVEGLNDNVVPLVYEVWEETIYQKGKAPSLTAKKPSPQPVEEPVEATQPETDPDLDPPKKAVPKADKATDASAKKPANKEPNSKNKEEVRNALTVEEINSGTNLVLKDINFDTVGLQGNEKIYSSGVSKIIDLSGRRIVLIDVNGVQVPFYQSSGQAGKKDVPAGRWYPIFGIEVDTQWINKTGGTAMTEYNGIPELAAIAKQLDAEIGDIRNNTTIPKGLIKGKAGEAINVGMNPLVNGSPNVVENLNANIQDLKDRISSGAAANMDDGVKEDPAQNPQDNDLLAQEGNTNVNEVEVEVEGTPSTDEVVDTSTDDTVADTVEVAAEEDADVETVEAAAEEDADVETVGIVEVSKKTVASRNSIVDKPESLIDVASISNNEPTDLLRDDVEFVFVRRGSDGIRLPLYPDKNESATPDTPVIFGKQDDAVEFANELEREGLGLYRMVAFDGKFSVEPLIVSRTFKQPFTPMVYDNRKSADSGMKTVKSKAAYDIHQSEVDNKHYIVTTLSSMDEVGSKEAKTGASDFLKELNTEHRDNISESIVTSGVNFVQATGGDYPVVFMVKDTDKLANFITDGMLSDISEPIIDLLDVESKNKSNTLIAAVAFAGERLRTTSSLREANIQRGRKSAETIPESSAVSLVFTEVEKFESIDNEDGSLTILGQRKFINNFLSSNKLNMSKAGKDATPIEITDVVDENDPNIFIGMSVPKPYVERVKRKLKNQGLYLVDGEIDGAVYTVTPKDNAMPMSAETQQKIAIANDPSTTEEELAEFKTVSIQSQKNPAKIKSVSPEKQREIEASDSENIAAIQEYIDSAPQAKTEVEEDVSLASDNQSPEQQTSDDETDIDSSKSIQELGEDIDSDFDDVTFATDNPWEIEDNFGYEVDPADIDADEDAINQIENSKAEKARDRDVGLDDLFDVDLDGMLSISRLDSKKPIGMSVEEVQAIIDRFESKYNGIPDIRYMVADVPIDTTGIGEAMGLANGIPTGSFDPKNKLVTINAAGVQDTASVEALLRHEVLAHYGLAVIPSLKTRIEILRKVSRAEGKNKALTEVFKNIRNDYTDYVKGWKEAGLSDQNIEAMIAEEVMAKVAEEADQSAFGQVWNDIISYFMEALRQVGFIDHYTKSDIRRTLMGIGKKFSQLDVETSLKLNGARTDVKFSIPPKDDLDDSLRLIAKNQKSQEVAATLVRQVERKPSAIPKKSTERDSKLHPDRADYVEVMPDLMPPRGKLYDYSSVYADSLDDGQRYGVDLALTVLDKKDRRGFLLADGTGFGKTRQLLAIADQYKKSTGEKVLIITENKLIIENAFEKDAASMGIDMRQFKIGTYTGFKAKGGGLKPEFDQDWGMVLFDEGHNLKNYDTVQAAAARKLKKKKVVYATATPMDKPSAGAYMWSDVMGKDYLTTLDKLGMKLVNGDKTWDKVNKKYVTTKVPQLKEGTSPKQLMANIQSMRNQAIKQGNFLKRYYPFFGEANQISVEMTDEAKADQDIIEGYWQQEIAASSFPKNIRGQRILELSKWEEHLKIDAVMDQLKDDLSKGKQVVVAAETISEELKIKGLDDAKVTGFISLIQGRLDAENIDYVTISGKTTSAKREKAVDDFQNGKTPLLVMTTAAGGTGINLDDTVGDKPRSLIMVTKNWSGSKVMQLIGRVSRKTTQSPSIVNIISLEDGIADKHKSAVVARKLKTLLSSSGEPSILDDYESSDWTGIIDSNGSRVSGDVLVDDSAAAASAGSNAQMTLLSNEKPMPTVKVEGDGYMAELTRHGGEPRYEVTKAGKKFLRVRSTLINRDAIQASLEKNPNVSAQFLERPAKIKGNNEFFFRIFDEGIAKQVATDLNDRGIVYSRQSGSEAARGLSGKSVKDVEGWVGNAILSKMNDLGHKVEVVQSTSDIPESESLNIDTSARGLFIPASQTSYLIADNLHSKAETRSTFSHEVVGHYGMQQMMGNEFSSLLEVVQDMKAKGDPEVMAAAKIVQERSKGLSTDEESQEIIAVLAEDLSSRSLMNRVYDAIRMWVKRTFANNYLMSNNNLRDLLLDAKRHVYNDVSTESVAPKSPSEILYSKVSKVDLPKQMEVYTDALENVHESLGGLAKQNFIDSTKDGASAILNQNKTRNFLQYWLTNTQIHRTYKSAFDWEGGNPLKRINDLLGEFRVDKERALHGFEKEEKIWDKLSAKEANSLASLMRDASIAGIHPNASVSNKVHDYVRLDQKNLDRKRLKDNPTTTDLDDIVRLEESIKFMKEEHARLSREWNKLTLNSKTVYEDTRVMLRSQYEQEREELLNRIDRQIESPVHRESAKKALETRMGDLITRGPYFPLSRFGDHVVIAFADINGKREFVREQFESRTEAERALKWHKSKWGDKNARMTYMADMSNTSQSGDLFAFRDNLFTALDDNRDETLKDDRMDNDAKAAIRKSTEQLKNEINDLMLNTLPSSSIMQRRRHRHGTKGASSDMRRSVQNVMLQSAQQISKIKYADRIRSELNDIGVENRKFATGDKSEVKQQYADVVSATHAEMSKRFELTMNPTGAAWASNAGRLAFFHYLGWSPAAAIVNLTQVPAISIPVIGARYGMAKTTGVFLKVMTDWHMGKSELSTREAYKSFARDGNKNVTKDEQNFIKVLIDRGDIDITRVGSITEEAHSDQRTPSVFGTKMQQLMRTGAYMFHGAEMSNREVTGLASFRLIKDKHPELFVGSTFKSSENMSENELKVYDEVRELIGTTQFLYESENRPRAMRENNIVRTMTTFKIYGQHIIYMYAQLGREALGRDKSLSPEKRREAQKALAGLVAFQMLAAGATGVLPIAVAISMMGMAYNMFADDEDEIVSPEAEFTQWIDDMVKGAFDEDEAKFMSALLSKGIGNALGVDISSRVSQDTNLLLMMPDRPMSSGKEWYKEALLSISGPVFGGIGANVVNFAQDAYEGNPTENIKSAVPKVIRDIYKAVDYSQNGVKTRNDLEVIESLDTSDIVIQAMGFTPEVVSSTYTRAFARLNKSQHIAGVRRDILGDVYTALSDGDKGSVEESLAQVTKWNEFVMEKLKSIKNPAMKALFFKELITSKTISSSLKTKMIRKLTATEGVVLPKKHMYLIDDYTFGT